MVKKRPCNCPDQSDVRPVAVGGCNYVAYSGNSPVGLYRLVEQAIPDAEMAHGRPVVHSDGSLEFPGTPPAIPNYRQDGTRLYPTWPPCRGRMLRVQVVDGVLGIAGICGNLAAEQFSLEVRPDACQSCATRQAMS